MHRVRVVHSYKDGLRFPPFILNEHVTIMRHFFELLVLKNIRFGKLAFLRTYINQSFDFEKERN